MTEYVADLENNLKQQITIYRRLVELEQEKQKALVENVIEKIDTITAQEETILLEVGHLEEKRLHWAEFFAKETQKNSDDITLTDLSANFPSLESVRIDLESVIGELRNLHEVNTQLLENAVKLVNFTVRLLTNDRQTTYSNPGDKGNRVQPNSLKVIDRSI
ncbi:flagellar protein FlgN [Dehalobacter sp. DCM]|uniref:flagellar protein FlgN n=1 Tax=Dehalobacter sp. DCM TaxID=2907827 RepID=UPI0030821431|nr:flagellar protein FlgN [Dehalobacter sp. DCM]